MKDKLRYLIVGDGAAGLFAVEAIRRLDREGSITVVSREAEWPYARCLITDVVAGRMKEADLAVRPPTFYRELGVKRLSGGEVRRIIPDEGIALLGDGQAIPYDRLLLATGAAPAFPPVPGIDLRGVFGLRTLVDARALAEKVAEVRQGSELRQTSEFRRSAKDREAVVIGAGPIGLEAAEALAHCGLRVTVVEKAPRVLPSQLDDPAAALIEAALRSAGIEILCGIGLKEIIGGKTVSGVVLEDGRVLPAELVLVATGVRPQVSLAQETGIEIGNGFLVDSRLRTNVPGVFAAGDAVEITDCVTGLRVPSGLWPNAARMGRIAGLNMAAVSGDGSAAVGRGDARLDTIAGRADIVGQAELPPLAAMKNSLDLFGIRAISVGLVNPPEEEDYQVRAIRDSGKYRKVVLQGDRLVGALFLGDIRGVGAATAFIESGRPLTAPVSRVLGSHWSSAIFVNPGVRELDRYTVA